MHPDASRTTAPAACPEPARAPRPLSLQGLELELETPADTYHSGNSVYRCLTASGFSMGC